MCRILLSCVSCSKPRCNLLPFPQLCFPWQKDITPSEYQPCPLQLELRVSRALQCWHLMILDSTGIKALRLCAPNSAGRCRRCSNRLKYEQGEFNQSYKADSALGTCVCDLVFHSPISFDLYSFDYQNMHLTRIVTLMGMGVVAVAGMVTQKQVLITYPHETPQSELNEFKAAIQSAVSLSAIRLILCLTPYMLGWRSITRI